MILGLNRIWRLSRNSRLVLLLSLGLTASAQVSPNSVPANPGITNHARAVTQSLSPYHLSPTKLAQAKALGKIRPMIHFGAEFWNVCVLWLLLATGSTARLGQWLATKTPLRWLQAAVFSAMLAAAVFVAVDLPVGAIGHFFSLRYGISVEAWPSWLLDQSKTLGLTLLVEIPLLMLAFYLTQWNWSRRRYWFWFAVAIVPLMLLFTFLLPPLVEPLFFDFEPLSQSHPALAQQLERVVARTGTSIPPERIFLMKASEKSNGLNAYVSGLGASRRIVVWDTTVDRMPTDQILFTFAHETGHYVLHHIAKGLTLAAFGTFALLWAVARLAEWLTHRCGKGWRVETIATLPGLTVLLLAFALLQIATEPVESAISRHFEHEADVFGQEAIHGLVPDPQKTAVAAFDTLGEAYLDDPNPNPFVEFWSYDHPSTQSRATFAAQYNPWVADQKPQFFSK